MIITRLTGGLGNQLFQYTAGRSLSNHLNVPLKLDVRYYENYGHRRYLLDKFKISAEIATLKEIHLLKSESLFGAILSKVLGVKNEHVFKQPNYNFYPHFLNLSDNTYLDGDGSWQNEKYFKNIEYIIRSELILKEPITKSADLLMEDIKNTNSVGIHIRRSDYFAIKNQKIFSICDKEYYQNAISIIKERTSNPKLFVFSDDIKFAHTLPFPEDTVYVEKGFGLEDYEELIIMSKCKNNITANSTFSWWSAWLNTNPNKLIITPKKWFIDETRYNDDLIPKDWIQL